MKQAKYYNQWNNPQTKSTNPGSMTEHKWKKVLNETTGIYEGKIVGTHNRHLEIQEHNNNIDAKSMLKQLINGNIKEIGTPKEYGMSPFIGQSNVEMLNTIAHLKENGDAYKNQRKQIENITNMDPNNGTTITKPNQPKEGKQENE